MVTNRDKIQLHTRIENERMVKSGDLVTLIDMVTTHEFDYQMYDYDR